MEYHVYLIVNIALAISCAIMSLIILFFPLPEKEGLKNYIISLRLMSLAYFSLFVLTSIDLLTGNSIVNFPIVLIGISCQTIFFSFSLINLMNSHFVNRVYVIKFLIPTLLFVILLFVFEKMWGNPRLEFLDDFVSNYDHPTAILNMAFFLFCIVQLIFLSALFISETKKYELKLDNYFADTFQLQLNWVRYCFYGAVAFCMLVVVSLFFSSLTFSLVITGVNTVFYTVFGLCYIQYPRTYRYIAPMMVATPTIRINEVETKFRNVPWSKHKSIIIDNKYYTRPEIDIEEMAQYLKIGRSTLSGYINREEKMSFRSWVNTLRVEEAQRIMITRPNLSLIQVSEGVGFSEPSNFSRQFKSITHQSPLEWKRKQLKKRKE